MDISEEVLSSGMVEESELDWQALTTYRAALLPPAEYLALSGWVLWWAAYKLSANTELEGKYLSLCLARNRDH